MLGKRLAILSIVLSLAVFLPKSTFATCYQSSDSNYASCVGGVRSGSTMCPSSPPFTACCNNFPVPDTCPGIPTPTSCGGPSGSCCPGGTCSSGLTCFSIPRINSSLCLTQSQCDLIGSGCIPPASPTIPVYSPDCGSDSTGVKTGLGCLSTNPQILVNTVLPWAIGIGSGIAFLLGLYGALMIVISAGDPEKMQAGKEMITSAVSGLLIIIFAVFILRVIGVDILQLFDVNSN